MKKIFTLFVILLQVVVVNAQIFETDKLLVKFNQENTPDIISGTTVTFQKSSLQNAFSTIGLTSIEKAFPAAEGLNTTFSNELKRIYTITFTNDVQQVKAALEALHPDIESVRLSEIAQVDAYYSFFLSCLLYNG